MRNWWQKLAPSSWLGKKLLMGAVLIGACIVAFCWGRRQNAVAQGTPGVNPYDTTKNSTIDYDRRIVAYLYQNEPITRAELGEYLIARFGADRLEFLINRKIVETECAKLKIFVTDAEVETRFQQDLYSLGKGIPLTAKDFETNILRRFNKTLYEWKEDVIRPKIMMEKLVLPQINVTEQDVKDGFEARYGPKVDCRMIVLQKGNEAVVQKVWEYVRQGPKQFMEKAAEQFIPNLAQSKGQVPPIHRHFGDKALEDAAFHLRVGEVSEPILMKDGTKVILLCDGFVAPKLEKKYENEWVQIRREVQEVQVAQEIPKVFAKMRERAHPQPVLQAMAPRPTQMDGQNGAGIRPMEPLPPSPPPTPLKAPEGYQPLSVQTAPLAPPAVLPPIAVPNFAPGEKK